MKKASFILIAALAGCAGPATQPPDPRRDPVGDLRAPKDFRVELIYSVPAEREGSWVALCVDPRGRLIASDQFGKLYRVTPPPLGGPPEDTRVDPIDLDIGQAQGLLWAFDSLYVVVNGMEKRQSGLYRVRDVDLDDRLDTVELLRKFDDNGEHGPHAVALTGDGKGLYLVAGNKCKPLEFDRSRVTRTWQEDHLLPRLWDPGGHAAGWMAPGGWIARTDPDGKHWELVASGFRNAYDLAVNDEGELFTFDSDMEWDMNMPWYRPTRICHVVSGAEFGWRSGSGVWPPYYPDSLPAAVDIGPGSPTGVAFGYGAKFPAKYREALFACDWSYGKLYAVHLEPDGSTWKGKAEEFITGRPLPLTDLVVNPIDGALYFAVGGRKVKSGLYRVTYTGSESTAPAHGEPESVWRMTRRGLEVVHGQRDPREIDPAWGYLSGPDRFTRYAARTLIEQQDPVLWQERALVEKNPQAAIEAIVALARVGDPSLQPRLLEALNRIPGTDLALLRAYGLAFIRMGKPTEADRERVIARLDPLFPSPSRDLNSELCQLLVYLDAPSTAAKTMALLEKAPTQEEKIEYLRCLRMLRAGWTPELRKSYFTWLTLKTARFRGGRSFFGFLAMIKADATATLTDAEKEELKPILEAKPPVEKPLAALQARTFVRKWTTADLAPPVKPGGDVERGRGLFATAGCFSCHRFAGDGGALGPDLTAVGGRFSPRDLIESIVNPSKAVSDQYEGILIRLLDGSVITGRIMNLAGDEVWVNTDMTDPNAITKVDRKKVEIMRPSTVSMMPEGLLDTFTEAEIRDLLAYLLSGGK